ncbi:hypothetical protein ABID30_001882 [Enterococcus rotai]|uniref:Uncharacterized protein n=1 Tax=Enterococcus rotai TaxID=118060 RepID=A0A0U2MWH5_9ENTE|nr:hypothetical protein [Enterococcus rotai]ALS36915.1 hypothetical protein ATZ35_07010 [Enterococcus rotai]
MITVGKSFELFLETLKHSNSNVLKQDDDIIEYYLLEEFAIEAPAFLSDFTLERLENEGIIDRKIKNLGTDLQKKYFLIDQKKNWDVCAIKESQEWKEILEFSDQISKLIHEKWTDEEIAYLKTI